MRAFFAGVICLGATLLVLQGPMAAHIALPHLGAAPIDSPTFFATLEKVLNDKNLKQLDKVQKLPLEVRKQYQEKGFVQASSTAGKPGALKPAVLDMANPDGNWNSGCMHLSTLPNSHLDYAGTTDAYCFVVFRAGGGIISAPSQVALFRRERNWYNQPSMRLMGIVRIQTAREMPLKQLRNAVARANGHTSSGKEIEMTLMPADFRLIPDYHRH